MTWVRHILATVQGVFGESAVTPFEQWNTTFRFAPFDAVNFDPDASTVAFANAIMDAIDGLWTGGTLPVPNVAHVVGVKVSTIDDTGHVELIGAGGPYKQSLSTHSTISGSSSSNFMPLQTALCVTLHTPRPGKHGRGRNYWPYPSVSLLQDGRLGTTSQTNYASAFQGFYNDLNDAAEAANPGVQNRLRVIGNHNEAPLVTTISLGRVLDTQRRRRGDLDESYTTRSLAA